MSLYLRKSTKPTVNYQGIVVAIENPVGSYRHWKDPFSGRSGASKMEGVAYGEIPGSPGLDGDPLDVFLGPVANAPTAFLIMIKKAPDFREEDELKVFLGFRNPEHALSAFYLVYDDPRFIGRVWRMPVAELREKIVRGEVIKSLGGDFHKAHVRAYDRKTKDGEMVHVGEYDNRRQARLESANPTASRRLAEAGKPSRKTSARGMRDRVHLLPDHSSTTARPSAFDTRHTEPSTERGRSKTGVVLGSIDESSKRIVRQPFNDVKEMLQLARESQESLDWLMRKAASGVDGVEFHASRIKGTPRLMEKIEQGRPAHTISDYLGSRLVVQHPQAIQAFVSELQKSAHILEDDDFLETPTPLGYRARHLQVVLPSGMSAEVQLVPEDILAVQDDAHHLYEEIRSKKEHPVELVERVHRDSNALFGKAWEAFKKKSGGIVKALLGFLGVLRKAITTRHQHFRRKGGQEIVVQEHPMRYHEGQLSLFPQSVAPQPKKIGLRRDRKPIATQQEQLGLFQELKGKILGALGMEQSGDKIVPKEKMQQESLPKPTETPSISEKLTLPSDVAGTALAGVYGRKLRNGIPVYAREVEGEIRTLTYANLTAARKAQAALEGQGLACEVYHSPMSRIFYVKINEELQYGKTVPDKLPHELYGLADRLIQIDQEKGPQDTREDVYQRAVSELSISAAMQHLASDQPQSRYPQNRAQIIRRKLAEYGFTGKAPLADLKRLRLAEQGGEPPEAQEKEAWEMTREEWMKQRRPGTSPGMHEHYVQQALAAGKAVSPDVLRDYPKLTGTEPQPEDYHGAMVVNAQYPQFSGPLVVTKQLNGLYHLAVNRPGGGVTPIGYDLSADRAVQMAKRITGKRADDRKKAETTNAETTLIPYSPSLKIRNFNALPRGTGASFLVAIRGQGDELVAKQWKRTEPETLEPGEVLVVFPRKEAVSSPKQQQEEPSLTLERRKMIIADIKAIDKERNNPGVDDKRKQSLQRQRDGALRMLEDGKRAWELTREEHRHSLFSFRGTPDTGYVDDQPERLDAKHEEAVRNAITRGEPVPEHVRKQYEDMPQITNPEKVFSSASRFRPKEKIVFEKPLEGPSGAKLVAYEWKWQPEEYVDDRGEDRVRRVSDWERAEQSGETNRDLVHQFLVETPEGTHKLVSAESVPVLLGYADKDTPAHLPSLVSATKTLARLKMEEAVMVDKAAHNKAIAEEARKQPFPRDQITVEPFGQSSLKWSVPGPDGEAGILQISHGREGADANKDLPQGPTAEIVSSLEGQWYGRMQRKLGAVPYDGYTHRQLEERIAKQEGKIREITAKAAEETKASKENTEPVGTPVAPGAAESLPANVRAALLNATGTTEVLKNARQTDAKFNGGGRYEWEAYQEHKDKVDKAHALIEKIEGKAKELGLGQALEAHYAQHGKPHYLSDSAKRYGGTPEQPQATTSAVSYRYGLVSRPPGPGAVPRGYVSHDSKDKGTFRHGVLTYDRPLSEGEIEQYELEPIYEREEDKNRAAKQALEGVEADHAAEYLKPENSRLLSDLAERRRPMGYADAGEFKARMVRHLQEKFPESAANTQPKIDHKPWFALGKRVNDMLTRLDPARSSLQPNPSTLRQIAREMQISEADVRAAHAVYHSPSPQEEAQAKGRPAPGSGESQEATVRDSESSSDFQRMVARDETRAAIASGENVAGNMAKLATQPHGATGWIERDNETEKIHLHFPREQFAAMSKEDKATLKRFFLWSPSRSAWVSKGKLAGSDWQVSNYAKQFNLEDRGRTGERLAFAEQKAEEARRAGERSDRLMVAADRRKREGEALQAPFDRHRGDISFLTQPYSNTSGGRAFRNYVEKVTNQYRRGYEKYQEAKELEQRAATAEETANRTQERSPRYLQNRLDEIDAAIRRIERDTQKYTGVQHDRRQQEMQTEMATLQERRSYYSDKMKELQAQGIGGHSKATIRAGDIVKIRGRQGLVQSANEKTVTFIDGMFPWPSKYSYAEIQEHNPAKDENERARNLAIVAKTKADRKNAHKAALEEHYSFKNPKP